MQLYTLDPLLRRQYIVEKFISLIWTERFRAYGDFQLNIYSTQQNRTLLTPDTRLAMSDSYYLMRIETVEDDVDDDGAKVLVIKGRSMEAILYDRVAFGATTDTTTTPTWTITDKPADVCRKVFHDICVTGVLSTNDIIPNISETSLLPPSTIAEPIDPITVDISPTTVYDAISSVANTWNLGFRFLHSGNTSVINWDVYAGSNRTSSQSTLTPVIFAPELDNLQNTKELTDITNAKNVAYVYSPADFLVVYADGVDSTIQGFDRHVLVVNADDITTDNPDVAAALLQRGKEALAAARTSQLFDGEISQNSAYKYGRDYNLGDIVEMRNTDGVTNEMRVTEQIFVQDDQGIRSYPTLELNVFINTGSWLSWLNNKTWNDLDTDTTSVWNNQP